LEGEKEKPSSSEAGWPVFLLEYFCIGICAYFSVFLFCPLPILWDIAWESEFLTGRVDLNFWPLAPHGVTYITAWSLAPKMEEIFAAF